MTFYVLAKYPEVYEKVMEEIDRVLEKAEDFSADTLKSMPYIDAVFKEVLRFYTPAPAFIVREALEDFTIGEFEIKKGYMLNGFLLLNNKSPKYFTDPDEF
eukprot:TRINITY_DN67621_c0_g1_i3.p1 TRINITY_DN67621_c0_g1~~TRINITY_DN67621_c0_g1_i3.p1  ORF type:complete len:101 (-),score=4.56 TRINITY_DN67621_c0_g1_i3:195-497(-)